jgi:hypothetical protein
VQKLESRLVAALVTLSALICLVLAAGADAVGPPG